MSTGARTSIRTYDVLGAVMAAQAIGDLKPIPLVRQTLDTVQFPPEYRWILAPIKATAAIGLVSARWFPGLARLTTVMLTLYFVLAVGAHARVRDVGASTAAAATFAALFAAVTVKGPETTRR